MKKKTSKPVKVKRQQVAQPVEFSIPQLEAGLRAARELNKTLKKCLKLIKSVDTVLKIKVKQSASRNGKAKTKRRKTRKKSSNQTAKTT